MYPNKPTGTGNALGGWIGLNTVGNVVEFHVGISYISLQQAYTNLNAESFSFDDTRAQSKVLF